MFILLYLGLLLNVPIYVRARSSAYGKTRVRRLGAGGVAASAQYLLRPLFLLLPPHLAFLIFAPCARGWSCLNKKQMRLTPAYISGLVGKQVNQIDALDLIDKDIDELDDLSPLVELKKLNLSQNRISNLDGLSYNVELTWLNLSNNQLQSLKGVAKFDKLTGECALQLVCAIPPACLLLLTLFCFNSFLRHISSQCES